MELEEAVRRTIADSNPNEPEELDEKAVQALVKYFDGNGYTAVEVEQQYDPDMYFLYDIMKYTLGG